MLFKPLDAKLTEPFLFIRGVAEYLPFRKGSFDAVYMGGMIEHVFDLNFSFSETSRVLKGGGHFYIFAGCQGAAHKGVKKSALAKALGYWQDNGFLSMVRRIKKKLVYGVRQRLSPWRSIINFSQGQTESGHIYDDLSKKDIVGLANRYGMELSEDFDVGSDTVFIFTKAHRENT